jgi:hypothetical protein
LSDFKGLRRLFHSTGDASPAKTLLPDVCGHNLLEK